MLQVDGCGVVQEGRRATRLVPGDLCLIPHDREMVAARPVGFRQVLVDVPTATMDGEAPRWRDVAAQPLPSSSPPGRAASDLIRFLADHQPMLVGVDRTRVAETAIGLLARLVECAAGGADTADDSLAGTRLAAFHRRRIDEIVRARLREPDLSVAAIARETRLSPRYIHKLFQAQRTSVMRRVTELRLDACLADLRARDGRAIGAIAYAWGFNSTAHFCRAFRARFGMRPSDV
jgi:AraC-like DNA-binding protein